MTNKADNDTDTETRRDWETIQQDTGLSITERLRVGSGWLVRTTVIGTGGAQAVAMVFVPRLAGE